MLLREKCARTGQDPEKARARLVLQHRKLIAENPFYRAFIRIYSLPALLDLDKAGGALGGASYAVKDITAVAGQPVSLGLLPEVSPPSENSAELVQALQRAGALLFGATNLDELCLNHHGNNSHFGRVVNPLDAELAVLGSSCGSAAAVARAQVDFALGSDFGGSVRLPAASCGLCGFRGSPQFLPRDGVFLLSDTLDSCGLITKYINDARFIVETLGFDTPTITDLSTQVFYIPAATHLTCLDDQTRSSFEIIVSRLRELAAVNELNPDFSFEQALEARKIIAIEHSAKSIERLGLSPASLPASAQAVLVFCRDLSAARRAAALCRAQELSSTLESLLGTGAILLTPTSPRTPPSWRELQNDTSAAAPINLFLAAANLCELPALSFPSDLKSGKVPFSLQLIAGGGKDTILLAIGELVQRSLSGVSQ